MENIGTFTIEPREHLATLEWLVVSTNMKHS